MDCNRDEAKSLKAIAEEMLERKNCFVAELFAKKAQILYPELEGISGLLATLRVYVSAEQKICGETDWYGVLNVNPSDDNDTIKKQYKKLALTLHPDKNKSVGAEGAFILMSEAWQFLSDKERRFVYDLKMGYKGFPQNVETQFVVSSAPPPMPTQHTDTVGGPSEMLRPFQSAPFNPSPSQASEHPDGGSSAPCGPSQQDVPIHTASAPSPSPFSNSGRKRRRPEPRATFASSHQGIDTFWTICHLCSLRFEHLRLYHNLIIGCLNCHEPFLASEAAPPCR